MSERDIVERLENAPSILNTPAEEWVEIVARDRKDARAEILRLRAQLASARDAALEEAAILMETETAPPNEYDQFPSVTKMVRKAGQKDRGERIRALKGQKP